MNATKFDEIVKNRANQRVQERLKLFRSTVLKALSEAYRGNNVADALRFPKQELVKVWLGMLRAMASEDRSKGWPQELWILEEKRVAEELLATMDEMQRALLAPEPSDEDCTPEAAGVEGL